MLQQVTISTQDAEKFKPLLRSALEREARLLDFSIQRTQEALKVFEERYELASSEFERQFNAREIEESLDTLDWWMEIEALHHLEEQRRSLENARLD
jgi:hypothetical protein